MQAMNYYATALNYDGAGGVMGINQDRMGLADGVTGAETPGQIANLQAGDKAMELQGIQDQTNYLVGQALQNRFGQMKRKELEMQRQRIQEGSIFG
jgi:hypothetical protein